MLIKPIKLAGEELPRNLCVHQLFEIEKIKKVGGESTGTSLSNFEIVDEGVKLICGLCGERRIAWDRAGIEILTK